MSESKSPNRFKIRVAKFSELWECSQVLGKAFFDDVLFGRHIHPYRHTYPEDIALFFYRMFQADYFDWAMAFLVATEEDQTGKEAIVGVAQWHRLGKTARKDGWGLGTWDPRLLLQPLYTHLSHLQAYIHPNRAALPTALTILADADPFTEHLWLGPRSDRWYLHFLGIHPDHQGKGIGKALVLWGLDRARAQGVAASVVAAEGVDEFYRRCGFRTIIGRAGEGEGNPLGEIPGGNVWWVDWKEEEGEVERVK